MLRLADHVVRDLTAQALDDAGRAADAAALRRLAPLRNAAAVQLATQRLQTLSGADDSLSLARSALSEATTALQHPDDPDPSVDICGFAAQALSTLLDAQVERIAARAEVTARQANAALALDLVRRLTQR